MIIFVIIIRYGSDESEMLLELPDKMYEFIVDQVFFSISSILLNIK